MTVYAGPQLVTTSGLVFYVDAAAQRSYPKTGTAWNDISGQGYSGTLTNGPTYSEQFGGQLSFDGTDDYSIHAHSALLNPGPNISIEAWIRVNNTGLTTPIFSCIDVQQGVYTEGYTFYYAHDTIYGMNSGLRLLFGMNAWAWNAYGSNGLTYSDTGWHHAALTAQSLDTATPTITFYLDSQAQAGTFWNQSTKTAIRYSSSTQSPRIGHQYTPTNPAYTSIYSNSVIGMVKLYNRVLTAQELTQNFTVLRSRYRV